MSEHIQVFVGLGNPGPQYENTRHNVGAWFINAVAENVDAELNYEKKFNSLIGQFVIKDLVFWLLLPLTYMNLSGEAVGAFSRFYKIPVDSILIAHDELDFLPGDIRLKKDGGHGGHNGLKSVIQHLGSRDFYRLRIGIGHPGHKNAVTNYVLSKPSKHEQLDIITAIDRGISVLPDIIAGNLEKAMNFLHMR